MKNDNLIIVGDILNRLRFIRISMKMNQTEFADRLKMAQNTYSHIETGKSPLTDKNIALICLTFGVNEDWLRTGRGGMYAGRPPRGSWENNETGPSSTFGPPLSHERWEDGSSASGLSGPYQDNVYNINIIDASTVEAYPKNILSEDIPFQGGFLHIDKTDKVLLFTYSYDKYYEEGEIPFCVSVLLYGKEDRKVVTVRINRIQVQDKDYNQLVMISDDVEYNTKEPFRIKIMEKKWPAAIHLG
jgi:transcriptional regulator with XRE-family HTH domain